MLILIIEGSVVNGSSSEVASQVKFEYFVKPMLPVGEQGGMKPQKARLLAEQ